MSTRIRFLPQNFWESDKFIDYSPEHKLISVYLLSGPQTELCGIFPISIKTLGFHLGLRGENAENAFHGFINQYPKDYGYDPETKEVAIYDWPALQLVHANAKGARSVAISVKKVKSSVLLKKMLINVKGRFRNIYKSQLSSLNMKAVNTKKSASSENHTDSTKQTEDQAVAPNVKHLTNNNNNNKEHNYTLSGLPDSPDVDSLTPTERLNRIADEVIKDLNRYKGDNRSHHFGFTKTNRKYIRARLKEGYKFEDFKAVNSHKNMARLFYGFSYFRPSTLYNSERFESYLIEAREEREEIKKRRGIEGQIKHTGLTRWKALVEILKEDHPKMVRYYRHLTFKEYDSFHNEKHELRTPYGKLDSWFLKMHNQWLQQRNARKKYKTVFEYCIAQMQSMKIKIENEI